MAKRCYTYKSLIVFLVTAFLVSLVPLASIPVKAQTFESNGFNFLSAAVDVTPATSGSWQTVNVAAYVPEGATGVILKYALTTVATTIVSVRCMGSSDSFLGRLEQIQRMLFVKVDSQRRFEAYIGSTAGVKLYLVGYCGSEVTFFTNMVDVSPTSTGSWVDVDVSSYVGTGATGVICMLYNAGGSTASGGIRADGSSDTFTYTTLALNNHYTYMLAGVVNGVFEANIQGSAVHVMLVGYTSGRTTFFTNAYNITPASTSTWVDVKIRNYTLANVATGAILFAAGSSDLYGDMRCNGCTDDFTGYYLTRTNMGGTGLTVGVDADFYLEVWVQSGINVYLMGYSCTSGSVYVFDVFGVYDEYTGEFLQNGNVTVYFDSVTPETFELSGSATVGFTMHPQAVFCDVGVYTREYWIESDENNSDIYFFSSSMLTLYTVVFMDYGNVLNASDYVNFTRVIGGMERVVEKRRLGYSKQLQIALVYGGAYTIETDKAVWDNMVFAGESTVTVVVRITSFPENVLLGYKYMRIWGQRNETYIVVYYEDTLEKTSSVQLVFTFDNGTEAHSYEVTGSSSWVYEWGGMDANTSYTLTASINHETFGALTWKQYFPRGYSEPPWNLDFLGDFSFESSAFIPALLIIFTFGSFTVLSVGLGAFAGCAVAALLTYLGWINIPPGMLVTAFFIAFLIGLWEAKRRALL